MCSSRCARRGPDAGQLPERSGIRWPALIVPPIRIAAVSSVIPSPFGSSTDSNARLIHRSRGTSPRTASMASLRSSGIRTVSMMRAQRGSSVLLTFAVSRTLRAWRTHGDNESAEQGGLDDYRRATVLVTTPPEPGPHGVYKTPRRPVPPALHVITLRIASARVKRGPRTISQRFQLPVST